MFNPKHARSIEQNRFFTKPSLLFSEIIHTMDITFIDFSDFEILRKQISKFFYILQAGKMNCGQPQDNLLELKQM